jgi:hypothetical protein
MTEFNDALWRVLAFAFQCHYVQLERGRYRLETLNRFVRYRERMATMLDWEGIRFE